MAAEYRAIRLRREVTDRLDALATEWGCSRAGVVRHLLDHDAPDVVVSRERALALLAQSAEAGNVSARVAYARATEKLAAPAKPETDPLDTFRASKAA